MAGPMRRHRSSAARGPSPGARGWLAAAAIGAALAGVLRLQSRRWWCRCGRPYPWEDDPWGPHNSQHLADPYTITHIHHGMLLYAFLRPLEGWLGPDARFALAMALEAAWEAGENTETVIRHYRKTTAAQGYEGDSVANSLGDVAACALGYDLASRLPVSASVALFLGLEASLLAAYRDNFTLDVMTGIVPLPAVKAWQLGH